MLSVWICRSDKNGYGRQSLSSVSGPGQLRFSPWITLYGLLMSTKAYRQAHKEEIKAYQRTYFQAHKEKQKDYYKKHQDKLKASEKFRHQERRKKVLDHYGQKCVCCGEAEERFLTIDHINNNGAEHKREMGNHDLYLWLVKNNFPEGFQTLCWNCNCGRRLGLCPHKEKLEVSEKNTILKSITK